MWCDYTETMVLHSMGMLKHVHPKIECTCRDVGTATGYTLTCQTFLKIKIMKSFELTTLLLNDKR